MGIHLQLSFQAQATLAYPWGVIVARVSDISASSATARPNPGNTVDWELPWLMLDQRPPTYSGATVDANFNYQCFIKSRRRIHDFSQALVICHSNPGAGNATFSGFARVLLALP